MGHSSGIPRRLAAAILVPMLILTVTSCARKKKKIHYTAVAVGRETASGAPERAGEADAALLAHLALTVTPRIDVMWRPSGSLGRTVLPLWIPASGSEDPALVVDRAREALRSLPRRWRRPSLKRAEAIGLGSLDRAQTDALVAALRARAIGDPEAAVESLRPVVSAAAPPILTYLIGAVQLDAGDLVGAAAFLTPLGESPALPAPLVDLVRAVRKGAVGEVSQAQKILDEVVLQLPSLPEARYLRAQLSRTECSAYDADRIDRDLRLALRASACCPSCALALSESAAFTGVPDEVARLLSADRGCVDGALDSMRDRARGLALAAAASLQEARDAASRAEARDASALLPGLAPTYLILGDHARLDEAYDSEADAHQAPAVSVQHHFYSGLNALWTGRPSAAAVQFERAEEHLRSLREEQVPSPSRLYLLVALRIRAFLAAGRVEEAIRAAQEARDRLPRLNGYLVYTTGLADLAGGDGEGALLHTERLTGTEEKYWRYLIRAQVALASGRLREAQTEIGMALQGINTEITFCPGIPSEVYLLEPQARLLLAQGRTKDAVRVLDRLLGLGARGLFAPEIVVPAWLLKGEALEALEDREGAALAYQEVVARWGEGEGTPAARRARERLQALSSGTAGGAPERK